MPISKIVPIINHWETKPEKLRQYADSFEHLAEDKHIKEFKNELLQTAKNLRKMADLKEENPFY